MIALAAVAIMILAVAAFPALQQRIAADAPKPRTLTEANIFAAVAAKLADYNAEAKVVRLPNPGRA